MKLTFAFLVVILLLAAFLRFSRVDQIPQGLYIDEVSIGYNASTILTKGVDEHNVSYPLFFEAFGEYKMPIPIYLTSLSIALFGKTDFAVRLPSTLFGTLTVVLLYFVVNELFRSRRVALLSAFFLAITPWHIQFSRGGFEANIALFLYLLGGFLFLQFLNNKKFWLLVCSMVFLILTIYTYNAYRLIAPVTIIVCLIMLYRKIHSTRKLLLSLILGIGLFLIPILLFSFSTQGNHRFSETSAFAAYAHLPLEQKIAVYPIKYLTHYFSYFSFPYLFVTGDGNGRHTVVGIGQLFRWEFPFLLIGSYYLFKKRKTFFAKTILFTLLLAPATAAFTQPSPHSLRAFLLVIPLTIICAYGLVMFWEQKKKRFKIFIILVGLFALYEFSLYQHLYYEHYPRRTAFDWGAGYKDVVTETQKLQKNYPRIVVNYSTLGMINYYYAFYNDKIHYQMINNSWVKPQEWEGKKVLFITSGEAKKNPYLQKIPHKLIRETHIFILKDDIFAQFWEI